MLRQADTSSRCCLDCSSKAISRISQHERLRATMSVHLLERARLVDEHPPAAAHNGLSARWKSSSGVDACSRSRSDWLSPCAISYLSFRFILANFFLLSPFYNIFDSQRVYFAVSMTTGNAWPYYAGRHSTDMSISMARRRWINFSCRSVVVAAQTAFRSARPSHGKHFDRSSLLTWHECCSFVYAFST